MSKKQFKKYRVKADDSMCLALSIVDQAAVETDFVCLGKQEMEKFVAAENKERRMIYGCALRADFPIYRNSKERGEYYLEFDSKAIDKISKEFFKNGFQSNWTEGHESEVEGLTITEAWIKESLTMDKSIALGLDPSIALGSWFIGCYCENDDIWNAVKDGKYHGFSCEALVNLEEFEKQIEPTNIELEEEPQAEPQPTVEVPKVEEPTVEVPKVEEPKVEEEVVEEPKVEEAPKVEESKDNHLEELINSLKEEIAALKSSNGELQEKIKDMGKLPSTNPINTNARPTNASGVGNPNYQAWRKQLEAMMIG